MILVALAFALAASPIQPCRAVDGDTLRCGPERVRLLGIDAPEMAGHCRNGRVCAPGDPQASTSALGGAIAGRRLYFRVVGRDRYGRMIAQVRAGTVDLSCHQLRQGAAIYVRQWDNQGAVRRACPRFAR